MNNSRILFVLSAAAATILGCKAGDRVNPSNPVASITVAPPTPSIIVPNSVQLTATALDANATAITGVTFLWGTNKVGVTTVDQTGLVTAVAPGGATITASASGQSGSATITVTSAGTLHTCGITTGGAAYCWGDNTGGQLGDGGNSPSNVPVGVTGALTFTEIAAGGLHTCAIASSGNIYCWGENHDGQLGKADTLDSGTPTQVFGGQVYSAVDAGAQSTCAILSGGGTGPSSKCWGGNLGYQVGNGDTNSVAKYVTPTAILAPTALRISTGSRHACIITTSKLAYCWGRNREGQMGIGIFNAASLPNVAVPAKVLGQP